ncbi:hypothetical protein P3T76_013588 [Phytophthora citrophthora]|uniref:Transmembrane protein n=1 Tax=Phytophthora citrophthora TaxID=4793 RepID=A0AAD9LD25_9STRA|nr:hypothetical protein P3T76_013588 [Phytophthora citrophthora]
MASKLREERALRKELLSYIVIIACQVVLTFIYPLYLYGFRSVSSTAQTFYVLLLPIIKIATKNWISFFLGTKDDLKPQVVILNIEVFNALYVASSMQNATSVSTTMALTLVDFLLAWISIKDVNHFLSDITALLDEIPPEHPLKPANFMDVALKMLDEDEELRADVALRVFAVHARLSTFDNKTPKVRTTPMLQEIEASFNSSNRVFPTLAKSPQASFVTAEAIAPAEPQTCKPFRRIFTTQQRMHYVHRTAQVLFTTEFIILIEFTEVIIPFIYSELVLLVHLPNRVFYPQIRELDEVKLAKMLGNIAFYGLMELLSFIAMSVLLYKKLRISTLHQLAFVLDRERRMVQSNLFLWICYTIQNSLDHNGKQLTVPLLYIVSSQQANSNLNVL